MNIRKRPRIIIAYTCGVLAITGAVTSPGFAAAAPSNGVLEHAIQPTERSAASAHWTLARMHSAVSARFVDENPDGGDPPEGRTIRPAGVATGSPDTTLLSSDDIPTPTVDPSTPVPGFSPADHVGVVFFRANGIDQRCTGNAVVSDSGDVVSTAGRCVSATAGKFVTDLAFVPGYNGTAPHGIWPAARVTAQSAWVDNRSVDDDTAFFEVERPATGVPANATLSSTVGASGVRFDGQQDDDDYQVTGYSTDTGSDPNKPISVTSSAEPNPWQNKDYAIEGLEWDARAGVSGSPWVSADADPIVDIQAGMTSFAYKQFTHSSFGPQWTATIRDLYRAAAATA